MQQPELLQGEEVTAFRESPEAADAVFDRRFVSVVVPIYNERDCLSHLLTNLKTLAEECIDLYEFEFVLVDDGSNDGTSEILLETVAQKRQFRIIFHKENLGIAAAIHNGILASSHETVVSIDADGSYDPQLMKSMIPLLDKDVDLVTASPYHPDGMVENVKAWRLWISRCASVVYRSLMRQKLYCCTSCYRVYRRSKVVDLQPNNTGFVGVAELLWRLDRRGSRIVEYPAVLSTRVAGASKMKVARATLKHLRFIGTILLRKAA